MHKTERTSQFMTPISPIEKKMYEYIKKTFSENGYSPSVRDIKNELSIKSTSTVHLHLKKLEEAGYIYKEEGKSRTVRLTDPIISQKNKIPILGYLRDGAPIDPEKNFDGYVDFIVPEREDGDTFFAVKLSLDANAPIGFISGDTVIIKKVASVSSGDTVISFADGAPKIWVADEKSINDPGILGKIIASVRFFRS